MSKRVVIGEIGSGNYGLRISTPGNDAINGNSLQTSDKLSFDTLYPESGVFIDRIYDVTVGANTNKVVNYGKTYSPFPFIFGTYKNGNTYISDCYSIQTITADNSTNYTNGLSGATLGKGFYWKTTATQLTVYNETSTSKTFRMFLLTLGATGSAPVNVPDKPTFVSTSNVTATSFQINFTAAGGISDGTRLDVSTDENFSTGMIVTDASVTSPYTVSGLTSGTLYYYRLRSVDTDPSPDVYSGYVIGQRQTAAVNSGMGLTTTSFSDSDSFYSWNASVEYRIATDGENLRIRTNTPPTNSNVGWWFGDSSTPGIGSSYYVQFQETGYTNAAGTGSRTGSYTGSGTSGWLQLNTFRSIGVSVVGTGQFASASRNITVRLSPNSSGTPVVSTANISLQVDGF